ncbi:MAG TPA: hypothetical protein VEQ85_02785 [Lacipirellulaceae bacterium]|nr:hypothetical protein [Lacipirellulaceae bacterium]
MWFANWFGDRSVEEDEPARFAPAAPRSVAPVKQAQANVGSARASAATKQGKSGFDPYNSGGFDRNQAWGRVIVRR